MMSFRLVSIAALMAVVSLMLQGCSDSVDDVVAGANTTTMSPEEGNATTTMEESNTTTTTFAESNATTTTSLTTEADEVSSANTSNQTLLL